MMRMTRRWTAADVPEGPYFHGILFVIEPGAPFDLTVSLGYAPENDWGVVNSQDGEEDPRTMFWGTTDQGAALRWGARYAMRFEGRLDRVYVWEVALDNPEVDVNAHGSERGMRDEEISSVMSLSGRFVRIVGEMSLTEYHRLEPDRR
jgi:hypothetical protein